jgi:hypothetical protein
MTSSIETRIQAVDAKILTPIVLRALGCTDGKLIEWTPEPMRPKSGNLGPSIIYRFSGFVQCQDATTPWPLVLKVSSEAIERATGHYGFGGNDAGLQREAALYRSGLIDDFPAGFRPAHCYALDKQIGESGHTEYWFWLEDLFSYSARWTIDDSYQAAYRLDLFNGTFIDHPVLPRTAWLWRDNVRSYMECAEPKFRILFADRTTPLIRRAFPAASVDSLMAMWQSKEVHLQTLDRLPQTLIHGDAIPSNLFLTKNEIGHPEIAAIDWNAVGVGPIGLDAAQLFSASLSLVDWTIGVGQLTDVAQGIYTNYLAGVQASAWQGELSVVRLGYTASMVRVRTFWVIWPLRILLDETMLKRVVQARGIAPEVLADRVYHIGQYVSTLFEESLVLRDQLL